MTGKAVSRPCRSSARSFSRWLPGAEAFSAEEDGDGAAAGEGGFQRLRPRLAGRQIPAIEKDANAPVDQCPGDALDRRIIAPVVAEEDVAGILHRPVPPKRLIDQSAR
jgi:hypothetical protein